MRKILILAAAAATLAVAGCNTIAGLGKDVQAAGSAVTRTADEAKEGVKQ
ncbi:MAG: entericidin A/B family lipoprotein [Phenylobacterium sp.]|nr:entericidin A/B family lipoprotein [Phenylobacterium sp.]MCA6223232.1 entericidin A/B family lipoprotein [Phenylobacterium sp.]MCA6225955.1 entericidin A/B family lipoprotein [Phenylobacterium sp.]MCA6231002.1 entericidin A/B family lipoprotein [Phenylobacterium sp.]MCA6235440.1 entericidin A/B family lipoprotein [Phenylobacterium sp.]MCA6250445.1 entericidin A/B family lipoprotein [Phenylobacterium sp.]